MLRKWREITKKLGEGTKLRVFLPKRYIHAAFNVFLMKIFSKKSHSSTEEGRGRDLHTD
jgi:hypothetical protein